MKHRPRKTPRPIQTTDLAEAIWDVYPEFGPKKGARTGVAHKAVEAIFDSIRDALRAGNNVYIIGLGTFKLVKIKEYRCPVRYFKNGCSQATNPSREGTPSTVVVPAHTVVRFTPAVDLRNLPPE